jgi:gas vesicle protein
MSENGSSFVAFAMGMVLGAFFGVVFALLFAPEAGVELRTKIQSGAQTGWEKAQIELERLKQSEESAPLEAGVQDPSIAPAME